jgi:hypothetical protein
VCCLKDTVLFYAETVSCESRGGDIKERDSAIAIIINIILLAHFS